MLCHVATHINFPAEERKPSLASCTFKRATVLVYFTAIKKEQKL
jgi:hypothetical protein